MRKACLKPDTAADKAMSRCYILFLMDEQWGDMAFVEVGTSKVEYEVDGQGPGLVLVHGTGADAQSNWAHLLHHFTVNRKVVRPNYSGSGLTEDDGAPLTMAQVAEQVVAAARAAGATPFDLVGYSLGASIAVYIAAEYPEDVRSLVLLAGFSHGDDTRFQVEFDLWRNLIANDKRAFSQNILLTGFSPAFVSAMSLQQVNELIELMLVANHWEGMARQVELDLAVDVRSQLGRIGKPTLVIGCAFDHMVPTHHSQALAAAIPGARYAQMETGHLAPIEQPETFARLVQEFLATVN